ncbi:Ig domain-containing protein [Fodinicola feengrottensis]|uniref:Ig domain-containing protein n=1 Tax=Fodinicola feengrottensis TaxID=435914 RepID=UPI0024433106|nr:Ig domain-containing protein [Fodinicola feengrottensis]
MSASPSSVTVDPGKSVTTTVGTTVTKGSAESVALSATGLPTGVTATFDPTSVTAGQSSTLTLTAAASATGGTSNISVSGKSTDVTHSAAVALTVTGGSPGGQLTVADPGLQFTQHGQSVTLPMRATGGTGSYAWSASGLPAGLSVDSRSGVISGRPSATGAFQPTVTATDAGGATGKVPVHLVRLLKPRAMRGFPLQSKAGTRQHGPLFPRRQLTQPACCRPDAGEHEGDHPDEKEPEQRGRASRAKTLRDHWANGEASAAQRTAEATRSSCRSGRPPSRSGQSLPPSSRSRRRFVFGVPGPRPDPAELSYRWLAAPRCRTPGNSLRVGPGRRATDRNRQGGCPRGRPAIRMPGSSDRLVGVRRGPVRAGSGQALGIQVSAVGLPIVSGMVPSR